MKDPTVIEFCRKAVFDRLQDSMDTIDAVSEKLDEKKEPEEDDE